MKCIIVIGITKCLPGEVRVTYNIILLNLTTGMYVLQVQLGWHNVYDNHRVCGLGGIGIELALICHLGHEK